MRNGFVDKVYLLSNPISFFVNRVKFSLNLIMMRASRYVEYCIRLGDFLAGFVAVKRKIMRLEECYVIVPIGIYETYVMVISL